MSSERALHSGFTLIEMMITVALVGIVAAIAYPSYLSSVQKSHRTDAKAALTEAAQRLERYYTENNTYVGAKFCSSGAACTAAAKVYDERSENGYYVLTLPAASLSAVTMITVLDEDEGNLAELREHPFVLWNTMLATPTSATYKRWGLKHPYGDDWMFSRDCIPPWISREEALDVCARTPREAIDKVQFVGTSAQVLTRLQPYLDLGVIDELSLVNYAELCGVKYMASAGEAIVNVLSTVKGVAPQSAGVTTLVTEGLAN